LTDEILEPFFLDTSAGRIFALYRAPADAKRCVLIVAPFAEEMNKSRRQFTVTSQGLIEKGFATLIVDLTGTGDSEGEFSAATWLAWKENIRAAFFWAKERSVPIESLIATRLGCLLAAETLHGTNLTVRKSVFWQPVATGRQFMTQFLRLRVAASMMDDSAREGVDDLKDRLKNGETLEVAGYELSATLWADVDSSDLLQTLSGNLGHLMLMEVGRARDDGLSPVGQRIQAAAEQAGVDVDGQRLEGEPFWSATEIVVNAGLSTATVDFLVTDNKP
jgi:exosortase A-associated hydrolase 2